MHAGVICGDRWHPAEVVREGMNAIKTNGVSLEFITETTEWSPEWWDRYSLIVLSKSNCKSPTDPASWLTEEIQQDFLRYVERGGGLLVIHSGTVGYKSEVIFRNLVGGVFTHHPAPCPVTVERTGIAPFAGVGEQSITVHDEHYFMELFNDDLNLFLASNSKNGTQPAGWTRQEGKGRVCVLTPGHYREVWLQPDYCRIIENAFRWCAGKDA